ncbi:MAG: hypothetical protein V4574_06965 [Pseudomonadota bacterium]
MSLTLALLAVTATCTPGPAAKPDVETVRAFIGAINARDEVAMGRFVKADATFAHAPGEATMKLTDILSMLVASNDHGQIDIVDVTSTADGIAVRTKTGDREMNSTLRLEGGCIVAMGQQ